ncbi:two-component sensor kinase/response regulator [Escherichia coli]|uniref:Two-component sensor kinase/response regulator n=1 Tax=Escherichia coli TaxID=562 RepID=A0A376UFP0_ECOLX|nr:two-component sensor kinase/response regulator [Escherichia coli]
MAVAAIAVCAYEESLPMIEQQLRSGTKEEDLEPELLELLDEMDNVAREASKILG